MKTVIRALVFSATVFLSVALPAQTADAKSSPPIAATPVLTAAPTVQPDLLVKTPDPETPTHYGMRYADFVQINEVMMQAALEDPAIAEFSKQVEAMIAQREEMIIAAACLKHPELAEKIQTMKRNVAKLKRNKAEQDEKSRDLDKGKKVPQDAPKS